MLLGERGQLVRFLLRDFQRIRQRGDSRLRRVSRKRRSVGQAVAENLILGTVRLFVFNHMSFLLLFGDVRRRCFQCSDAFTQLGYCLNGVGSARRRHAVRVGQDGVCARDC